MVYNKLQGIFHRTKDGSGYVTVISDDGKETESIPLAVTYDTDIYEGDTVLLKIQDAPAAQRGETRRIVKLAKVVKRAKTHITGVYRVAGPRKAYIVPDSYIPFRVPVKARTASSPSFVKAADGDKVAAEIGKYSVLSAMRAEPVENFGANDTYLANFKATLFGTKLFTPFAREIDEQVMSTKPFDARNFLSGRTDMRSKTVFTFTDSVFDCNECGFSMAKTETGWRVGIHVSDIAEYVERGGILDTEAAERGRQILGSRSGSPMFPRQLLDWICAFNEKSPFLSVSALIDYDELGNIINTELKESVISPVVVASADDIDALIKGTDASALLPLRKRYAAVYEQITMFYELAATLRAKRIAEGGVDFDACSREFAEDRNGRLKVMACDIKNDSVLMMREILVSAGIAVAEKMSAAGAPCIYCGMSETKYDNTLNRPEDRHILAESEYYKEGYTREEAIVSRGTPAEKYCFERITLEADTPGFSFSPIPHRIYAAPMLVRFFRPTERYSDLENLRAIKAYINDRPFDVKKSVDGVENEKNAAEIRNRLVTLMTLGFFAEPRERAKIFDGTVLCVGKDGEHIVLDTGSLGFLPKAECGKGHAIGDAVQVKVKEVDYINGRLTLKTPEAEPNC